MNRTVNVMIARQSAPVAEPPPPEPTGNFMRHLHDYELGIRNFSMAGSQYELPWDRRAVNGDPEVYWIWGGSQVPFTEPWQWLAYRMNETRVNKSKFSTLYDDHRAFMNNKGFWNSQSPWPYAERRNYVTGENLKSDEMPAWDKVRVCGGAIVKGVQVGDFFHIEYLAFDPDKPNDGAPELSWLMDRPWLYFEAVTCHVSSGKPGISPFNQGGGGPVYIPLVAMRGSVLRIPMQALQPMSQISGDYSPYKMYVT